MAISENTEAKKSKKDLFLENIRKKRPDINPDDEEGFYGALNDEYDQGAQRDKDLEGYKKSEQSIIDLFNKNPGTAELYTEMATNGTSPLEYFTEKHGEDFITACEDPDVREKLVAAQNKYIEKQAKNAKLEEEAAANLESTLDNLDAAAEECGVDDDVKTQAFEQFASILDDAIVDKVSKETFSMIIKGISHDADVEQASTEGELKGRNAKISQIKKREPRHDMPPVLTGQGGNVDNSRNIPDLGALSKVGAPDVYQRGGMKRVR